MPRAAKQGGNMSEKKDKKLPDDFDTTAELWDRIADDVAARGTPCFDTVEELLKDASEVDPKAGFGHESKSEKE
jgi:hypothetical protein